MSTVVTQLLADYIVTAELEGDRVMGKARRATRTCSDRGDDAEIGRFGRFKGGNRRFQPPGPYALFICYNVYFLIQF